MRNLPTFSTFLDVAALSDGELGLLSYWRLASGIEVDFILGDMQVAIEAKSTTRVTRQHLNGLRKLVEDHTGVKSWVVVSREPRARRTDDGILILPAATFVRRLWSGDLLQT